MHSGFYGKLEELYNQLTGQLEKRPIEMGKNKERTYVEFMPSYCIPNI